jgi:hypothetical protein
MKGKTKDLDVHSVDDLDIPKSTETSTKEGEPSHTMMVSQSYICYNVGVDCS